jgi:hypothetical protein
MFPCLTPRGAPTSNACMTVSKGLEITIAQRSPNQGQYPPDPAVPKPMPSGQYTNCTIGGDNGVYRSRFSNNANSSLRIREVSAKPVSSKSYIFSA